MCIDMFSHLHDLLSFCTELSFRRLHAPSKWLGFKCEGPCSGLEPQNGKKSQNSCDKHSVVLLQGAEIVEHPDRMKRKELKESLLKQRPTPQSIDGCSILPIQQTPTTQHSKWLFYVKVESPPFSHHQVPSTIPFLSILRINHFLQMPARSKMCIEPSICWSKEGLFASHNLD